MFIKVKEYRHVLFQQILNSPKLWMVYTSILIHGARMKTKGKELVKINDVSHSCAHEIFPVAVNINICRNNTVQTLVRLNKKI